MLKEVKEGEKTPNFDYEEARLHYPEISELAKIKEKNLNFYIRKAVDEYLLKKQNVLLSHDTFKIPDLTRSFEEAYFPHKDYRLGFMHVTVNDPTVFIAMVIETIEDVINFEKELCIIRKCLADVEFCNEEQGCCKLHLRMVGIPKTALLCIKQVYT